MNNQSEKPIEELLRGVPQDHRICIPFQWAEDGRETGHHYIPVGRHVHQAADKITALREELTKCKVALADRDSAWRLYKEAREAEVQQASRADEAVTKNAVLREKLVQALAIAKKYEPDEKTSYVKYASDEIAELLKEMGK